MLGLSCEAKPLFPPFPIGRAAVLTFEIAAIDEAINALRDPVTGNLNFARRVPNA